MASASPLSGGSANTASASRGRARPSCHDNRTRRIPAGPAGSELIRKTAIGLPAKLWILAKLGHRHPDGTLRCSSDQAIQLTRPRRPPRVGFATAGVGKMYLAHWAVLPTENEASFP